MADRFDPNGVMAATVFEPPTGYRFTSGLLVSHDLQGTELIDQVAATLCRAEQGDDRQRRRQLRAQHDVRLFVLCAADRYTPGPLLPWATVMAFLAAIDRTTPMGRRDYAIFLLIATYGLRTSEVAGLRLDDIEWRASRLRVRRPKTQTPLVLPLTDAVESRLPFTARNIPSLPP